MKLRSDLQLAAVQGKGMLPLLSQRLPIGARAPLTLSSSVLAIAALCQALFALCRTDRAPKPFRLSNHSEV